MRGGKGVATAHLRARHPQAVSQVRTHSVCESDDSPPQGPLCCHSIRRYVLLRSRVQLGCCLTCVVPPDDCSGSKAIRGRNGYNVDGCCLRVQMYRDRRRGRHRHRSSCHSRSPYVHVAGVLCCCFGCLQQSPFPLCLAVPSVDTATARGAAAAAHYAWQFRASTQSQPGEQPQPLTDKEVQGGCPNLCARRCEAS